MTNYNYDKVVDRHGTASIKWDGLKERFGREDLLALWVADMDFDTPDFVVDAIKERLEHPVLGYTLLPEDYYKTIVDWQWRHNHWEVKEEWLTYIPGIVKGIGMVINEFTKPGDKVIVQPPVYHPFYLVPQNTGREVVWNPLKPVYNEEGEKISYSFDFEHLKSVIDDKCKILILANPHNPGGVCWSAEDLAELAHICKERGVLVISDEIHSDMPLWGHKHVPFASVSEDAASNSITFAAPSKTFNIAGVVTSYAVVPNDDLRQRFYHYLDANELNQPHMFAPIATIAAYKNGDEWLRQMLAYVESNCLYVRDFLRINIPSIKPMLPQASFLMWLDATELADVLYSQSAEGKTKNQVLNDFVVNKAKLALNDGSVFGQGGECHLRLNVGTSREVLERAMSQLLAAVQSL